MHSNDAENRPEEIQIPVEVADNEPETDEKHKQEDTPGSEDYLSHLQRLQAEFANYKRRTEKEKESLAAFVKGNLITQLLPVLDDFNLLIQHHPDSDCPVDAVKMILQKLNKILTDEGLETIEALHQPFDPDIHEALAVGEVEDETADGSVLEEWQKGYRFHGNLLRPSRVKVARFKKEDKAS